VLYLHPLIAPAKKKIIALNECIGMKYVAINQGPHPIQKLALAMIFYFKNPEKLRTYFNSSSLFIWGSNYTTNPKKWKERP